VPKHNPLSLLTSLSRYRGFLSGLLAGLIITVIGCSSQSVANKADMNYTDAQTAIYSRGQPLHQYDYSQDRASFLAIYDARVAGKATYSVSVPQNGGHPWFECPSRGYPIPADTELTNPERPSPVLDGSSTWVTLPQAEPNGTFSGHGSGGTYIQCVDTDGSLYSVYSEPNVMTFPFPVVWKGDHYEKANPNDRASFALPTAPAGSNAPTNVQSVVIPTPTLSR
jgi:hypothetical protein